MSFYYLWCILGEDVIDYLLEFLLLVLLNYVLHGTSHSFVIIIYKLRRNLLEKLTIYLNRLLLRWFMHYFGPQIFFKLLVIDWDFIMDVLVKHLNRVYLVVIEIIQVVWEGFLFKQIQFTLLLKRQIKCSELGLTESISDKTLRRWRLLLMLGETSLWNLQVLEIWCLKITGAFGGILGWILILNRHTVILSLGLKNVILRMRCHFSLINRLISPLDTQIDSTRVASNRPLNWIIISVVIIWGLVHCHINRLIIITLIWGISPLLLHIVLLRTIDPSKGYSLWHRVNLMLDLDPMKLELIGLRYNQLNKILPKLVNEREPLATVFITVCYQFVIPTHKTNLLQFYLLGHLLQNRKASS